MNRFFIFIGCVFITLSLFSQNDIKVASNEPSIFKKHQQNTKFLNTKRIQIDSISNLYNPFFSNKISNSDKLTFIRLTKTLQQSFQEFTDFNSKRLVEIDKTLEGNKPIKGSDIAYLHHSFQVYKKYIYTYIGIEKNLKYILKKTPDSELSQLYVSAKLSPMSFFYKNYYSVIKNTRIRRIINASDTIYKTKDNDFKKLILKELKKRNYKDIQKELVDISSSQHQLLDSALVKELTNNKYRSSRIRTDKKKINNYFQKDNTYKFLQFITHNISGFIGNVAGSIRFRKGYLYKNDSIRNLITSKLQPMDIIAEKTGFALTDKMIPGHFGHIAIWLGTEQQLKDISIWNTIPKQIQQKIRKGYSVLESARNGTHLLKLDKFINVDELAIARIKTFNTLSLNEKDLLYKHALAQLGKKYDFNFDVETSDKLVCSELLYQVFGSIYWPTDRFLKRATISPDNVLSLALFQNTPIDLIYYVEGKSKRVFCEKTLERLAKELGYIKQDGVYFLPDVICEEINNTEKCKRVYHELIYQE